MNDQKLSVLIVDDETTIRKGIKKLFDWEEHGFRIAGEAENGLEALNFLSAVQTDIVITDLKMPVMDGISLSNELSEKYPSVQVVIITGFDEFSYVKAAIKAGVADFLLKPVDPIEFEASMLKVKKKILNRSIDYPFDEESDIKRAILNSDLYAAKASLNKIFENFRQNRVPLEAVRNITQKILNEISIAYKLCSGEHKLSGVPAVKSLSTLTEIQEELFEFLPRAFDKLNSNSTEVLVKRIIAYLEQNYNQNISLKSLETEFHFNASYISRVFKAKVGKNYNEYLLDIRLFHAKQLLTGSNLSIVEISEAVGFENAKYFSRVFKKNTGLQPVVYRKCMKK